MQSKYKRLLTDIGIFALGALGSKLIIFVLLPLYTNVLTEAEYGIADLVFTMGQLILPVISLAIFNGLLRYGLMTEYNSADVFKCATYVFVIGSLVTVAITPLFGLLPFINEWKWYLCLYVISLFAVTNSLVYLKVKDKNKLYALLSILQTFTLVVCNVVTLVIFRLGIKGYLLSYLISNLVTFLSAFFIGDMYMDLKRSKYSSSLMRAMVCFSVPYLFNDISWWLVNSSNKLIIEIALGSAMLGIFTTATKIPSMINSIASIFTQAWGLSSIREYDSTNDTTFYTRVFNSYVVFILGVCIVLVSIMKPFMSIYVSAEFFQAWQYVPLLLLGAVFISIASFMGSLLGAMKKSRNIMNSTFIGSIANVIVSLLTIKYFGIWGSVIGSLCASVIVAVHRLLSVKSNMDFEYDLKKLLMLSCLAFTHAVLVGLDYYVLLSSVLAICVYVIIAGKDIVIMCHKLIKR